MDALTEFGNFTPLTRTDSIPKKHARPRTPSLPDMLDLAKAVNQLNFFHNMDFLRSYLRRHQTTFDALKACLSDLKSKPDDFLDLCNQALACGKNGEIHDFAKFYAFLVKVVFPTEAVREIVLTEATRQLLELRMHRLPGESGSPNRRITLYDTSEMMAQNALPFKLEVLASSHQWALGLGLPIYEAEAIGLNPEMNELVKGIPLSYSRFLEHTSWTFPKYGRTIVSIQIHPHPNDPSELEQFKNQALIQRVQMLSPNIIAVIGSDFHKSSLLFRKKYGPVLDLRFPRPVTDRELQSLQEIKGLMFMQFAQNLSDRQVEILFAKNPHVIEITSLNRTITATDQYSRHTSLFGSQHRHSYV